MSETRRRGKDLTRRKEYKPRQPREGGEYTYHASVWLTDKQVEYVEEWGKGVISVGIRAIIDELRRERWGD